MAFKKKETKSTNKDRIYVLCNGTKPAAYFVRNDGLMNVFDPETKTHRYLVLAEGQNTVWRDEIKGTIIREEVSMDSNEGIMRVSKTNPVKQKFMELHPDNVANGGLEWEEFDAVAKVEDKMSALELKDSAIEKYKTLKATNPEKLKTVAQAKGYSTAGREVVEWMFELREFADQNPQGFLDAINDPLVECTSIVTEAIDLGVISNDNPSVVKWGDSNQIVLNVPQGRLAIEALAEYINSNEDGAKATKKELLNKLKELGVRK